MLQHLSASFDAAGFLSVASLLFSLQTLSLLIKPPLDDSETFNLQASAEANHLPQLTEFKIYVDDADGFIGLSDVFSSLSVPVLRHFEFDSGDLNGTWFRAFISMLRRSEGCQLEKIVLVNEQSAQEDLAPLFDLPALSSLTHLHINAKDRQTQACPLSEMELEALNPRLTRNSGRLSACLLNLKVLSCSGHFGVEDLVNLISLVKSRALYVTERQEEQQSIPKAGELLDIQPLQTVKIIHLAQSRALQIIQANTLDALEDQTGTKVILQSEDKAEICSSRVSSYYFHNYDASLLEDALLGRRWPECEKQGSPQY
ncbi:unnamed protein product [Cyclocybe aegerita]|uniref:Uncharacterized protein n=1 Tax=Cyclocybe aegerita TaxID=1973307 RepID=A0A8S0VXM9_CYCAE|nr:unnamed protein product [Cyclocybe aegerita]